MSKLKITMTIDPDAGEPLFGLLAKAFGRGELGIGDLQVERVNELSYASGYAEGQAMKAAMALVEKPPKPRRKRPDYELGMRARKTGKPNSVTTVLNGLKRGLSREGIVELARERGFGGNGVGSILSKLQARGLAKRVGKGHWRLTPKGEDLEQRSRLNDAEVVEHDGSEG